MDRHHVVCLVCSSVLIPSIYSYSNEAIEPMCGLNVIQSGSSLLISLAWGRGCGWVMGMKAAQGTKWLPRWFFSVHCIFSLGITETNCHWISPWTGDGCYCTTYRNCLQCIHRLNRSTPLGQCIVTVTKLVLTANTMGWRAVTLCGPHSRCVWGLSYKTRAKPEHWRAWPLSSGCLTFCPFAGRA